MLTQVTVLLVLKEHIATQQMQILALPVLKEKPLCMEELMMLGCVIVSSRETKPSSLLTSYLRNFRF